MPTAEQWFRAELSRLTDAVAVGGTLTGEPAEGDRARALSDVTRRPLPAEEYSIVLVPDSGPVEPLAGPVPPSGIRVVAPESPGLWRAQVEHVWSMPKPEGPGRSIKLCVESADTREVLGWLEMASAPLVMGERDRRYPVSGPNVRVDLRTVGAHPDLARWRGSSLVGLLGLTDAVLSEWVRRYGNEPEIVQTTGAFGVTAVYERKRLPGGRGWVRVQRTSGTYPVLSESLVAASRAVTGAARSRHPEGLDGRENIRRRLFLKAMEKCGFSRTESRRVCRSLGVRRALYVCPVEVEVPDNPQAEVDAVFKHWLEKYARAPIREIRSS